MSGVWYGVALRTDTKNHVFERDWTVCYKRYDNHSKFNRQHD